MKTPVAFALTAVFAALIAAPVYAAEAASPAKADLAKGEETSKNVCAACHTNDGSRGVATYPILQGQHADYLVKQLTEFKSGKRKNTVMSGMAATLATDADVKNVAAFYASKAPVNGAAKNKDTVVLGEKIYRGGIAEKHVPACAGCHSPNGAGIPAQYPRLAGQHSDYVEAQLNTFRSGERSNSPQMSVIAANMSDKEIKAVADYVMGLR